MVIKGMIKRTLLVLLSILLGIVINYLDRNILDEIYLDAADGGLLFNNVKEAEEHIDYLRWLFFTDSKYCIMSFDCKYLRDEYAIIAIEYMGDEEPDILTISSVIYIEEQERLYIEAKYNYKTKTLTWQPLRVRTLRTDGENGYATITDGEAVQSYLEEAGVTKKDIKKHQDYILKETVLKKWAKGNYRFPFHLMKGIKVTDSSWDFTE